MITILHTADWHLGYVSRLLEDHDATKLARARLAVVERILGLARSYAVDAVLCAGDLFDTPDPPEDWWRGLLDAFHRRAGWSIPVVLLPGNHDPLTERSVYAPHHPFRVGLPEFVQVVDRDDFELSLGSGAVVLARPCRSSAGDADPAMALPARAPGDARIRIGLVHGSTFDLPGFQTNFPIAREAPVARGLDYLAIGDTHAFREVVGGAAPIVYPGAPEPTNFGEPDAGSVAVVRFTRTGLRPTIHRERVGQWAWREVQVREFGDLRALVDGDPGSDVLRVRLALEVSMAEEEEVERLLQTLAGTQATRGRAGALLVDRSGLSVRLSEAFPAELPDAVRATIDELSASAEPAAKRALQVLHRELRRVGGAG